jgi:hypothetical protein
MRYKTAFINGRDNWLKNVKAMILKGKDKSLNLKEVDASYARVKLNKRPLILTGALGNTMILKRKKEKKIK